MKSFGDFCAEEMRSADRKRVKVKLPDGKIVWRNEKKMIRVEPEQQNEAVNLDGVEIIMGATKSSQEAEKEVAKRYNVTPAKAKQLVQQVIKRSMKGKK